MSPEFPALPEFPQRTKAVRWQKFLSEIEQQSTDSNSAIKAAYATGANSQRVIGEHFHLHPSTVGVIVREDKYS